MTTQLDSATSTTTFEELGTPAKLASVLREQGITSAFPIQVATLPDSLAGRDILGRGRTGSGKTIAFSLPLVARLAESGKRAAARRPRALVLVPTRELATQVHRTLKPLASAAGLTTMTIFGGVSQNPQAKTLARGVDIVVACPGRLEDLMRQGGCILDAVEIVVLDEADHMADLGFLPGVKRIMDATPAEGQRMLFSATLDNGVDILVKRYLDKPISHSVDDDASTEPDMEHHVMTVRDADKAAVIEALASGRNRAVLFTRTKSRAKRLAQVLTQAGLPAVDLHGNLSQNARERNLSQFRDGSVRVLVATDVAARGIHVDDVALVVHVDPPTEHKSYLHRSGRTARAGASGVVVTLQTPSERAEVTRMTRKAGITVTATDVTAGSAAIKALVGPQAERVALRAVTQVAAKQPARNRSSRGSGAGRAGSGRSGASASGRSASSRSASGRSSSGGASGGSGRTGRPSSGGQSRSSAPRSAADFSASRRGR